MPMNTANKLTLARVFMIPLFLVIAYWGFPGSRYVALGVYILACLTDLLDGYVARHYNQVSDFGKFADPLADKCLVMAALCWFVETGDMVGWVLAVVLLREFAVSGMRLIAVEKGRVLNAGRSLFQHCRLAGGIVNGQAMGSFVFGHLQHSSHPPLKQRSQLGIHRVDLGARLFQCVHGFTSFCMYDKYHQDNRYPVSIP